MIDRKLFVPTELIDSERFDQALPMPGGDYTISQSALVAEMVKQLEVKREHAVLEIGGGTGYHAACLAESGARVVSVERLPHAVAFARDNLRRAGLAQVEVVSGDGFAGIPGGQLFDRISIACAVPAFPINLWMQLRVGGMMIYPASIPGTPVGAYADALIKLRKLNDVSRDADPETIRASFKAEQLGFVQFIRAISPTFNTADDVVETSASNRKVAVFDAAGLRPEVGFLSLKEGKHGGLTNVRFDRFEVGIHVIGGEVQFRLDGENCAHGADSFVLVPPGTTVSTASLSGESEILLAFTPGGAQGAVGRLLVRPPGKLRPGLAAECKRLGISIGN